MAIKKACIVKNKVSNTGKECDTSMLATAMIIAMKRGYKFTELDLADPVAWLTDLIQRRIAFPLFGAQAPIREMTNDSEGDILITLDDGLKVFLRYGVYNRMFATTSGGLCYANALQSFNKSGYDIIEIDLTGQMLVRTNSDKTLGGLITDFMYAPSPVLADLKNTPFKNRFSYSYSPTEMVNNGAIFTGAEQLLSMMGLIDAEVTKGVQVQTSTNIFVGVKTECGEDNLVEAFPVAIKTPSNFILKNKATGVVIVPTAGAVVAGEVKLTGVYPSGSTILVTGSTPDIWQTNLILGYDANSKGIFAEILIP